MNNNPSGFCHIQEKENIKKTERKRRKQLKSGNKVVETK